MPTSAEFWDLAEVRLKDAEGLLSIKRWACAYYIAGYAVECALKAFIVRGVERTGSMFNDKKGAVQLLDNFFIHDLDKLFKAAELEAAFGVDRGKNAVLNDSWDLVKAWKETSRYDRINQSDAETLVQAINHDPNGVMKWIRDRW